MKKVGNRMKKKLALLLSIFIIITLGSVTVTKKIAKNKEENQQEETVIVTSFYPMYVLVSNLTNGIEGIQVVNLTSNQTGCLHDYQLTTRDMRTLADAHIFVMNGGGMESYIEEVVKEYSGLRIINASETIVLLSNETVHDHEVEGEHVDESEAEHDHEVEGEHVDESETEHNHEAEGEHGHEHHSHGAYNPHVWLNMNCYLKQIQQVSRQLSQFDQEHANLYQANATEYSSKVKEIKALYEKQLKHPMNKEVIIFHDAFAYLANQLGLDVVYTIEMDSETSLSAGDIKDIIQEVKLHDIRVLFTEEQYSDTIASSIAKETGATVYSIDSLVTGDGSLDSYLNGMKKNLEVLKSALYQ